MRLSILALLLAGCTADFTTATVSVDQEGRTLTLRLLGPEAPPCAELELEARATIDGMRGSFYEWGGEAGDPDGVRYGYCEAAEIAVYDVVFDGRPIVIQVDSVRQPMRLEAPWDLVEYRTDDDLAAAMRDRTSFEVTWTPSDADVPELSVYGTVVVSELDTTAELVEAGPGRASFTFTGPMPRRAWSVALAGGLEREGAVCEGLVECRFSETRYPRLGEDSYPAP